MEKKETQDADTLSAMNETNADMDINTDDNVSGTSHLNEPVAEESEMEKLKEELEAMKDKYLRHVAEFDNYKKRSLKERMEIIQTAGKDVIIDMLDVLDDCERAQKQIETTDDFAAAKEGVLLVFSKLKNTLMTRGLKPMESMRKGFNPDLHEAITEIPAVSDDMKGKVMDEVQKGYYLNDKIIRFAKVVVGK
jgi:molecular chaperone GrpE